MDRFDALVQPFVAPLTQPPVSLIATLLIAMYAAQVRPQLLPPVATLLEKGWFRALVLFLIVWTSSRDPTLSLVITLAVMTTFNALNGKPLFEMFSGDYAKTATPAGCLNITMYDLLAAFNNDKDKLVESMVRAGVPPRLTVNDANAPLIAAYLMTNSDLRFSKTCGPPYTAYTQV